MKTHVLRGSKEEIARDVVRIDGFIREAIILVDDVPGAIYPAKPGDWFAEMEPFTVQAGGADYSRESLYARKDGE